MLNAILQSMVRLVVGLAMALFATGCKSRPLGPYVSPRVTGQVLAADSYQPLVGVKVVRGSGGPRRSTVEPPKGGELLMIKPPVETDKDGRFVIESQRVLSIVRGKSWNIVSLSFDLLGYEHLRTNWPAGSAIDSNGGEPVLNVGKVLLQPVSH